MSNQTNSTGISGKVHQNKYLSAATRLINAVLVIVSSMAQKAVKSTSQGRVFGFILDKSGSMSGEKWSLARRALAEAIETLPDGVEFFVILGGNADETAGNKESSVVLIQLTESTEANRKAAATKILNQKDGGGTYFGYWLKMANKIFKTRPNALKRLVFLTDGDNCGEGEAVRLPEALEQASGLYEVDARGIGVGYKAEALREIATKLGGTVGGWAKAADIFADNEDSFPAIIERMKGLAVASVQLQIWSPPAVGAVVKLISLREPEILDLTHKIVPGNKPGSVRVDLGAFGEESRLYQLMLELPEKSVGVVGGPEKLIARASVIITLDGVETEIPIEGNLLAEWTDDDTKSAVIHPKVAKATGQADLAAAIQEGVAALNANEPEKATQALKRAQALAEATGNEEATKRISRFIEQDPDGEKGTVRLRRDITQEAVVDFDTKSTKTQRVR